MTAGTLDELPTLFLDIDEVLCVSEPNGGYDALEVVNDRHPDPEAVLAELFDARACHALAQVHAAMNGKVRYVVSSSWREFFDRQQMDRVFRGTGLAFIAESMHDELRWCTPRKPRGQLMQTRRVDEILQWLELHHRGEPFVILDDSYSGPSLRPSVMHEAHPFQRRVLLCREGEGLLEEHVDFIVGALKRRVSRRISNGDVR